MNFDARLQQQQTAHINPLPGWRSSSSALFFALTGTLIATSVLNVGESGVAFFYLVFLIPLFALAFPDRILIQHRLDAQSLEILALVSIVVLAISGTTLLQMAMGLRGTSEEIVHLSSRLSFLFYLVIAQRCIRGELVAKTLVWLRRLLIIVCAYGIYQLPAKLFGLPLFLDWLRNNQSLGIYDYNTAGWLTIVRATSIFAEPSQATIPIVVLFMLNLQIKSRPISMVTGWVALLLFTVLTFSRTAWIALFVACGIYIMCQSTTLCRRLRTNTLALATAVIVLLLVLPAWAFVSSNSDGDLSQQERSASIVLAYHMVSDSPLMGFGWNSFSDLAPRYSDLPLSVSSSIELRFIHNMVLSYVQQVGLSGLMLAALPFILIIRWSTATSSITYSTLGSFLMVAEFGGDIGYSSLMWLWIVLLLNSQSQKMLNATNVRLMPALRPPI